MTLGDEVPQLVVATLKDPRATARRLIAEQVPVQAIWLGLVLVSVMSLMVLRLSLMAVGDGQMLNPAGAAFRHPVTGTLVQAGSILLIAGVMTFAGRVFGGRGRFIDALLLIVWLEFILTALAAVQLITLLLIPVVGIVLSVLAIPLFIWLMVSFAAALHGFQNMLLVLLGMIGVFVLTAIALSLVLVALGIDPNLLTQV